MEAKIKRAILVVSSLNKIDSLYQLSSILAGSASADPFASYTVS